MTLDIVGARRVGVNAGWYYTGLKETSAVLRAALTALVERESARRLARLGGSEPNIKVVRRRRTEPA